MVVAMLADSDVDERSGAVVTNLDVDGTGADIDG